MKITLGLVGSGIQRSRMPLLQQYLGQLHNIDIAYHLIDASRQTAFDPVRVVLQARDDGYHALNVTHPFKQTLYSLVEAPRIPGHEQIGSYNTLLLAENTITGANTDYSGFIKAWRHHMGQQQPGRVVLVGAGGVGRAVAVALKDLGCEHLGIHDIAPAQAESLATLLRQHHQQVQVISNEELPDAISAADGLINCTAIGMHNKPGSAIALSLVNKQRWAFDAVYTPLHTEFLTRCKTAGLQCLTGFDLWINQGLDSFRLFTGIEVEATEALVTEALSWQD